MHSPATDFNRHERAIRELIIKAYLQCKRFLEYLGSAPEVPIYRRVDGKHVEAGRLRRRDFRVVLPIGLTVEAFTPFSAMAKEFAEITPLFGKHPFISMSVDDLFVLNRFLPSAGELLHYLEVRQQVAGIPRAVLFDEIEHLGAYISNNRFDISIKEQLKKADMVAWDSFGDVVDKYFEGDTWRTSPAPHQEFPELLAAILIALDQYRPNRWLQVDSHIRDFGGEGRNKFCEILSDLKATLHQHPIRRFLIGDEANPMLVWLCRNGATPSQEEVLYQGQVSCLAANSQKVMILRLTFSDGGTIIDVTCASVASPSVIQMNYPDLMEEAQRQRARSRGTQGR